ncbi:MAG: hypothetical protein J6S67_23910 [Methanobrevibacter sp.]|nr:hypothetical protein [Methanobrevibacter sp.]
MNEAWYIYLGRKLGMSKEETLATKWGEFVDMLNCRAIENGTARQIPPKQRIDMVQFLGI